MSRRIAQKSHFLYTTNPTERSVAATEHLKSESDLESPVESHRAWQVLGGILQTILNHFHSSIARWD